MDTSQEIIERSVPISFGALAGGDIEEPNEKTWFDQAQVGPAILRPEPDWTTKYPSLYGVHGVARGLLPYVKYIDPSERERFVKLSQQEQTRELLLQDLQAVGELAGAKVFKALAPLGAKVAAKAGAFFKKALPKTHKFLTKDLRGTTKIDFIKTEPTLVPAEPKVTLYRRGEREGRWWTTDKKYADIFGTGRPLQKTEIDVSKLNLLDTRKGGGKFLDDLSEPAKDMALKKKGYDGYIVGGEKGEPIYYLSKPKIPKGVEPFPRKEVMPLKEFKQIGERVKAAIKKGEPIITDPQRKIMYDVQETIVKYPDYTKQILKKYNITPEELADDLIQSASQSGRTLNQLSQIRKTLMGTFKDKALQEKLKAMPTAPEGMFNRIGNFWVKIDRPRRMMMVAQLATAARNAISQAGYYTLRIAEDAMTGFLKTIGGKETPRKAFLEFAEDVASIVKRLSPTKRKQLNNILDQYTKIEARLLTAPIHDITIGGKMSKVIMFFNRMQENVFRKMAFEARLTALAKKEGIDLDNLKGLSKEGQDKLQEIMEKSVDNALEITFAQTPKAKIGNVTAKQLIDVWQKIPGLTTIQPFPRFWANSVKFLWDFNPTGFITAASRATINKGGKDAYEAMSRATMGSAMLGMGFAIRNSEYAGERWYEIKTGGKTKDGKDKYIDVRAFAPFSSYLFLAEVFLHPERLGGYDWAQGVIGINRIAGTGLVLIDALRSESLESAGKMFKRFTGEFLGGYTVGIRSVKDLLTIIKPKEAVVSATRDKWLGPAMENIPIAVRETLLKYKMPPAERLTRPGGYVREQPVLRQFTGLTMKGKTGVEQELDRLNLRRLWPKSGDAELDRKIIAEINVNVAEGIGQLVESEQYKEESDTAKKAMIRKRMSSIKEGVENRIGIVHYTEKFKKLKTRKARLNAVEFLAKKKRLSKSALINVIGQLKLDLTDAEKKVIIDYYR